MDHDDLPWACWRSKDLYLPLTLHESTKKIIQVLDYLDTYDYFTPHGEITSYGRLELVLLGVGRILHEVEKVKTRDDDEPPHFRHSVWDKPVIMKKITMILEKIQDRLSYKNKMTTRSQTRQPQSRSHKTSRVAGKYNHKEEDSDFLEEGERHLGNAQTGWFTDEELLRFGAPDADAGADSNPDAGLGLAVHGVAEHFGTDQEDDLDPRSEGTKDLLSTHIPQDLPRAEPDKQPAAPIRQIDLLKLYQERGKRNTLTRKEQSEHPSHANMGSSASRATSQFMPYYAVPSGGLRSDTSDLSNAMKEVLPCIEESPLGDNEGPSDRTQRNAKDDDTHNGK